MEKFRIDYLVRWFTGAKSTDWSLSYIIITSASLKDAKIAAMSVVLAHLNDYKSLVWEYVQSVEVTAVSKEVTNG